MLRHSAFIDEQVKKNKLSTKLVNLLKRVPIENNNEVLHAISFLPYIENKLGNTGDVLIIGSIPWYTAVCITLTMTHVTILVKKKTHRQTLMDNIYATKPDILPKMDIIQVQADTMIPAGKKFDLFMCFVIAGDMDKAVDLLKPGGVCIYPTMLNSSIIVTKQVDGKIKTKFVPCTDCGMNNLPVDVKFLEGRVEGLTLTDPADTKNSNQNLQVFPVETEKRTTTVDNILQQCDAHKLQCMIDHRTWPTSLDADIMGLECKNCDEKPILVSVLCPKGHISCKSITPYDCSKCHTLVNLPLHEEIHEYYNKLKFPCKGVEHGCQQSFSLSELKYHEDSCEYCKWYTCNLCSQNIWQPDILEHVKMHPEHLNIHEHFPLKFEIEPEWLDTKNVSFIQLGDRLFEAQMRGSESICSVSVKYLGHEPPSERFSVTISVWNGPNSILVTSKALPYDVVGKELYSHANLLLKKNVCIGLLKSSDVNISCTINEIETKRYEAISEEGV